MKKILIASFLLLASVSCGKKEAPFEVFSPEAFAFDLGDSWEINAQLRVRGFTQLEKNGYYNASVEFTVDLIRPDGESINSIFRDEKTEGKNEVIMDLPLEAQFDLDSTYQEGSYTLIFNAQDKNSDKRTSAEIRLELKK